MEMWTIPKPKTIENKDGTKSIKTTTKTTTTESTTTIDKNGDKVSKSTTTTTTSTTVITYDKKGIVSSGSESSTTIVKGNESGPTADKLAQIVKDHGYNFVDDHLSPLNHDIAVVSFILNANDEHTGDTQKIVNGLSSGAQEYLKSTSAKKAEESLDSIYNVSNVNR